MNVKSVSLREHSVSAEEINEHSEICPETVTLLPISYMWNSQPNALAQGKFKHVEEVRGETPRG